MFSGLRCLMYPGNRVHQVGFSQSDAGIQEQRIKGMLSDSAALRAPHKQTRWFCRPQSCQKCIAVDGTERDCPPTRRNCCILTFLRTQRRFRLVNVLRDCRAGPSVFSGANGMMNCMNADGRIFPGGLNGAKLMLLMVSSFFPDLWIRSGTVCNYPVAHGSGSERKCS